MSLSKVMLREASEVAIVGKAPPWRAVTFTNNTVALPDPVDHAHHLTLPSEGDGLKLIPCNHARQLQFAGMLINSDTPVSTDVSIRIWSMVPWVKGREAPEGDIETADYQEWFGTYLGKYTLSVSASGTSGSYPATGSLLGKQSSGFGAFADGIADDEAVLPSPGLVLIGETAGGASCAMMDKYSAHVLLVEAVMNSGTGTRFDLLYREI